ncbi:Asp-tRNA(Asn)/Glu-tRNA(Gln) amidotransferase subunit GatC [Desulfoluna spongiiphila]|uniref:Aspartyl/glutamyl-tRNA(Asn/Gln) amidotransferase subunit C n=1 Tax=Desulfoluna spongiiphila TaxID=419481 RepID=A0A1G5JKI3_9BACT|nr:Asp-tRNA(Asn)/Glu-tRNA(Gln) amidotransferase subunit GatC [Desulfoluna spongiiphila]SCY88883.1 aspartyl/glutamyl-tRNA(Asn/Gln) amidotransferase subunit C [Desulfoluna spongiiphila]
MKITKEEVLYVANLARLNVDDGDVEKLAAEIGDILSYVDTLEKVDTDGVEPTTHAIDLTNAFREDVVHPHPGASATLANAPDKEDEMFVVPKVVG